MKVEILKCVDCTQLFVSVDDIRFGHKCSNNAVTYRSFLGSHPMESKLTIAKTKVDELIVRTHLSIYTLYNRKYSINAFHTLDSLNGFLDKLIDDLKRIKELL